MPLFEVAVIETKKVKEENKEKKTVETLVLFERLIAKDKDAAAFQATIQFADKLKEFDAENMTLHVRPF